MTGLRWRSNVTCEPARQRPEAGIPALSENAVCGRIHGLMPEAFSLMRYTLVLAVM